MGEVERQIVVEKLRKEESKRLGRFAQHQTRLNEMQADYGFNLDVAHLVYGDKLLNPDAVGKSIEKWNDMLSKVKENPGKELVLIKEVRPTTAPRLRPRVLDEQIPRPPQPRICHAVALPEVRFEDFIYNPGNRRKNEPPFIAIASDKLYTFGLIEQPLELGPERTHDSRRALLLELPPSETSPEFHMRSPDLYFAYDPSSIDDLSRAAGSGTLYIDPFELRLSFLGEDLALVDEDI